MFENHILTRNGCIIMGNVINHFIYFQTRSLENPGGRFEVITESDTVTISQEKGVSKLVFLVVRQADEGFYHCRGTSEVGDAETDKAELIVEPGQQGRYSSEPTGT